MLRNLRVFSNIGVMVCALLFLGACSGLNLGTVSKLQSVDVLKDDIAQMRFAIDAPLSVLPQDGGIQFKLDATTTELGERHIVAVLQRGEDILSFPGLKPPANKRTYHLFAVSLQDQEKIRDFQAWIRNLTANNDNVGGELSMQMEMQFCRVGDIDISDMRVSVHVSIPGQQDLSPLLSNIKLSDIGDMSGNLPYCVQTQ
ncbi:MAG: hypothetical protein L3J13_10000 [Devosiaceae bacterium]|nr:hypothetical protein [Devosiaceae bacterium]